MRSSFWASVALCWIVSGCQESRPVVPAGETSHNVKTHAAPAASVEAGEPKETDVVRSGDFIIGEPVRHENLTVFPIRTAVAKDDDRFVTLDEGLKAGTVEVMEVGAHPVADESAATRSAGRRRQVAFGAVNSLQVVNRSEKPLYLMPGEIIVGGKQDRCIGSETIVEAGEKPVLVDAYCVEHGRWRSRRAAEFAPLASAILEDIDDSKVAELTQQAASGKFVGSAGNLGKKARYSAQSGGGQSSVWSDVALANAANGAQTATDTFTANYAREDVQEKLSSYVDHLENAVATMDRVVGVVVAINGKVEMADVYESTPLFKKLWPKLLKSYALDAMGVADENDASKVCDVTDAAKFLDEAREADVAKTDEKGGLIVTARSSKNVETFSAGMMGEAAGFGGSVHSAGFGR